MQRLTYLRRFGLRRFAYVYGPDIAVTATVLTMLAMLGLAVALTY